MKPLWSLREKKIDRSNRCSAAGLSLHSQSWISYQTFLLYLSESSSDMLRPVSTEIGSRNHYSTVPSLTSNTIYGSCVQVWMRVWRKWYIWITKSKSKTKELCDHLMVIINYCAGVLLCCYKFHIFSVTCKKFGRHHSQLRYEMWFLCWKWAKKVPTVLAWLLF